MRYSLPDLWRNKHPVVKDSAKINDMIDKPFYLYYSVCHVISKVSQILPYNIKIAK